MTTITIAKLACYAIAALCSTLAVVWTKRRQAYMAATSFKTSRR